MIAASPSEVQQFLGGVDYPAHVDDLVNAARSNGADGTVVDTLQALPDDDFQTAADVSEALGDLADASWHDKSIDPSTPIDIDDEHIADINRKAGDGDR